MTTHTFSLLVWLPGHSEPLSVSAEADSIFAALALVSEASRQQFPSGTVVTLPGETSEAATAHTGRIATGAQLPRI